MRRIEGFIILLSVIITAALLAGCGGNANGGSATIISKPGELRMARMSGMGKGVASLGQNRLRSSATSTITFDLGTIKASQDYYFLLSNAGDVPVTDVTITASNGNFVVSPGKIDVVAAQNDSFVTPVIKVSVTHGVTLNGYGFTDKLLPMGDNSCNVTITGKTIDSNNNVIDLSYEMQLHVFSEVMDVELYDDATPVDFTRIYGTSEPLLGATEPVVFYNCAVPKIKNTGNVEIQIDNFNQDWQSNQQLLESFTLKPNEEKIVQYPDRVSGTGKSIVLIIRSNNTIADYRKLKIQPDGALYVGIGTY